MIAFPNCKINLGLHILKKRADGFHDLETVFYPVPLMDALEIVQGPQTIDVQLTCSGLPIEAAADKNICVKAARLLRKDFSELPSIRMHLHKVIPCGAGLGGGSSDGAFTLILLNRKFNLERSEEQLIDYALQLGSDCPFFIKNRPCYATGRGEKLETIELDLSGYRLVLVNPGIHIPTGPAFSRIIPNNQRRSIREVIKEPVGRWKDILTNDFEESVFGQYPEIRIIKEQLYLQGAIYASMSGSGSSVFGLFEKNSIPPLRFPSHYFIKML